MNDANKTKPASEGPNRKVTPPSGLLALSPLALAALENGVRPEDVAAYMANRLGRS